MLHCLIHQAAQSAVIAVSLIFVFAVVALAHDGTRNRPGHFDYYMLSLSWSPIYCADAAPRPSDRRSSLQCNGRPFTFIVHGLWPQYVSGFPS